MVEKKSWSSTSRVTVSVQWYVETRRTHCPLTNTCWGTSGYLWMKYELFLQAVCGSNICCNCLSVKVSAADYIQYRLHWCYWFKRSVGFWVQLTKSLAMFLKGSIRSIFFIWSRAQYATINISNHSMIL